MTAKDLVLVKLETARQALAEAKTIQETKKILDVAAAAEIYAKRQQLGDEAVSYATSIKVEALAQLGRMLHDTQRNTGVKPVGGNRFSGGTDMLPPEKIPTLAELGITKKTSKLAQDVAKLSPSQLEKVKTGVTTISRAMLSVTRKNKIENILSNNKPIDDDIGIFNVIYVDPPWRYEHVETESRAIENQYPTMTHDEICALPVDKISAPDCVMFVWATSPKLLEAMKVLEAWKFNYRTCAVWVKDKIGMGYYFRQRHELLLVATRGELPTPSPENRVDSVIESPRGKHSAKPEIVYELIDAMYPEYAKCELFARNKRKGWKSWGNQS